MQTTVRFDRQYVNLTREFAVAGYKLKDQRTFLGLMWSFLHPLIMLVLLFTMFQLRFASEVENFATYLLIGIVHIAHFSNATSASVHVLRSSRHLALNTTFPTETLVVATVLSNTVEFVIALLLCLVIGTASGVPMTPAVLLLPVVMLLQVMLVLWVSLFLAASCVFVADIGHLYQLFLRLLYFITPVFYDIGFLGSGVALKVALANPLTHLMGFSRTLILDGVMPSAPALGGLFVLNGVLIVVALVAFRRLEPLFGENL